MELDFEKENGLIPAIVQDARQRRSADARIHEPRGARADAEDRLRHVLQPLAQEAVDQGRDQRPEAACCASCASIATWTRCWCASELDGGAVCHEGYRSCFFRRIDRDGEAKVVAERVFTPEELYGKGSKKVMSAPETRHSQGQPAGFDGRALRQGRLAHFRQLAQLLSRHRRSRNRMHAGARAGNGALRRKRRARRRPHGQGLDSRDRRGRAGSRRAGLFEDEPRPRALGAGRGRGFRRSKPCATSKEK